MFRKLFVLSFVLVMVSLSFAADEQKNENSWSEHDWPFSFLPKWETKAEKQVQPSGLDRLTPPPTMDVVLDPEFGFREGVIMRYPYGFGNQPFLGMIDAFQEVGIVYMLVENAAVESNCYNYVTSNGVPWENIECIYAPTNANWTRDYGPWFVWEDDSTLSINDLIYYSDRPQDDYIPEFLESYWGLGYYGPDIHHEGGNMMTDGNGTLMMTTRVYEANPGMNLQQVNDIHREYFGQDTTYVFQRIQIDATGHIDLWSKMMNDTTILVAQMQPGDVNYNLVEQHAARMDELPTAYGGTFHIVRCPMPPVQYQWGFGYYKSYINSTLFNNVAVIPIYEMLWDQQAIEAYQEALGPAWEVIGVNSNSIAWAGGAIHCTSIGVPYHEWDYLIDVAVTLEANSLPITIPANGGSFQFDAGIDNLESNPVISDFWVMVTLPDGSEFGPVLKRNSINLASLASLSREDMTQNVPQNAPPGIYTYTAYAGSYLPEVIRDEQSFEFEKLAADYSGETVYGWSLEGWDGEWTDGGSVGFAQAVPGSFKLEQNYPNPFNPETTIEFNLNESSKIELLVYNVNGQIVDILFAGTKNAGNHSLVWNAENVPSGVYFYSLKVGSSVQTKKMLLVK